MASATILARAAIKLNNYGAFLLSHNHPMHAVKTFKNALRMVRTASGLSSGQMTSISEDEVTATVYQTWQTVSNIESATESTITTDSPVVKIMSSQYNPLLINPGIASTEFVVIHIDPIDYEMWNKNRCGFESTIILQNLAVSQCCLAMTLMNTSTNMTNKLLKSIIHIYNLVEEVISSEIKGEDLEGHLYESVLLLKAFTYSNQLRFSMKLNLSPETELYSMQFNDVLNQIFEHKDILLTFTGCGVAPAA